MSLTRRTLHVSLLSVGLVIAACGGQPDAGAETTAVRSPAGAVVSDVGVDRADERPASERVAGSTPSTTESVAAVRSTTSDNLSLSPLSSRVVELPNALPERVLDGLGEPIGRPPAAISLPSLGVDNAQIVPVGLEENGELEVPGAEMVGWYQFGAGVGGGRGAAVLAAHIAYNGRNGVFVGLSESEVGDRIVVTQDGVDLDYRVDTIAQYGKFDLPIEKLFAESGDEKLVLITCGGSFNPSLQSYDDNVVVIATPT